MDIEQHYKSLISNSEQRLIDTKKMLNDAHKYNYAEWFKSLLHECKNREKKWLKHLIDTKSWEKTGGPMPC